MYRSAQRANIKHSTVTSAGLTSIFMAAGLQNVADLELATAHGPFGIPQLKFLIANIGGVSDLHEAGRIFLGL